MGVFSVFLFTEVFNYLYTTLLPIIKLLNEQIMEALSLWDRILFSFSVLLPQASLLSSVPTTAASPVWCSHLADHHFLSSAISSLFCLQNFFLPSQPNHSFHILFWFVNLQNSKFSPTKMEGGRSKILVLHLNIILDIHSLFTPLLSSWTFSCIFSLELVFLCFL